MKNVSACVASRNSFSTSSIGGEDQDILLAQPCHELLLHVQPGVPYDERASTPGSPSAIFAAAA